MKLGLFFAGLKGAKRIRKKLPLSVSASIKTVAAQAATDYNTDFDDLEAFDDEELGSGFLRDSSLINKRLANPFFNLIQDSNEDVNIMERASFRELLEERLFLYQEKISTRNQKITKKAK